VDTATALELLSDGTLRGVVDQLVRLVEAAGAGVIAIGALVAVGLFLRALPRRDPDAFVPVRLFLARFLTLGLEFQLASDVLRTAIAPTFDELGKLAAVAAIRTALNFFLAREMAQERRALGGKPLSPNAAAGEATASHRVGDPPVGRSPDERPTA